MRLNIGLAALAAGLLGTAAIAAETRGFVEEYAPSENMLTLENGEVFHLRENYTKPDLDEGIDVTINYEVRDGRNVVETIIIESDTREEP